MRPRQVSPQVGNGPFHFAWLALSRALALHSVPNRVRRAPHPPTLQNLTPGRLCRVLEVVVQDLRADWQQQVRARWIQRLCCFSTIRLLITWFTVDSTNAVEINVYDSGKVGLVNYQRPTPKPPQKYFEGAPVPPASAQPQPEVILYPPGR